MLTCHHGGRAENGIEFSRTPRNLAAESEMAPFQLPWLVLTAAENESICYTNVMQ